MRTRYVLEQFKRKNTEKHSALTNNLVSDLAKLEKVVMRSTVVNKRKRIYIRALK